MGAKPLAPKQFYFLSQKRQLAQKSSKKHFVIFFNAQSIYIFCFWIFYTWGLTS